MRYPLYLVRLATLFALAQAFTIGCTQDGVDVPDADLNGDASPDANVGGTDTAGGTDAGDETDAPGGTDAGDETDVPGGADAGGGADGGADAGDETDVIGGTDAGGGTDGGTPLRCAIPSVIDTEVVVDTGCLPIDSEGARIVRGGRLVVSAGVTVRFASGAVLVVEGGGEFSAQGAEGAPVTLEGATAERGSWEGILARFAGTETSIVRLEHAVVRHGGLVGAEAAACLTSIGTVTSPNIIELRDTTISDCATYGVLVAAPNQDFAAFERVTITASDSAMSLHADVIGSIPAGVTLDSGAVLQNRGGTVQHTQTWQPQSVPWQVDAAIAVGGSQAPVLTLAEGLVLEFVGGGDLLVGATPGGLVADRVTFRRKSGDGPWGGIRFLEQASIGTLSGVTVSGTGGLPSLGGFIAAGALLRGTADRISIRDSVFSDNTVDIAVDCASTPVLTGNTAEVTRPSGC